MSERLIMLMVQSLLSVLTPDLIREFMTTVLNFVEARVLGTASKVDDAIVLPLIDVIRRTAGLTK